MRILTRRNALFGVYFAAAIVIISGAGVVAFYKYTKDTGLREAANIGVEDASNSIRHAYAAGEAYAALRAVGLPEDTAEHAVTEFGIVNEWIKRYFKTRPDSTAKVYKDLFNNLSGIATARWLEKCETAEEPPPLLQIITSLAAKSSVIILENDARIPSLPKGSVVSAAIRQFRIDRDKIASGVTNDLNKSRPGCV